MSTVRPGTPGATRTCPHCRATILERSAVCPACRHHLRFDPSAAARGAPAVTSTRLRVEGTITQPVGSDPIEYSVVISITNDKGEEIARHIVGVGALHPEEKRTFILAVEAFAPGA